MNTAKPVDRILTEEELYAIENSYGIYTPALAERYPDVVKLIASHRAQSEYIQAQDEAAKVWMKENEQLRSLIDSQHILLDSYETKLSGGLIYD